MNTIYEEQLTTMPNFNQKLEKILKKDIRFIDQDGDLLKSEVVDKAWKVDPKLIELLLDDKELKQKFFFEIKKHSVFNASLFVDFVQDKNFLNDSYTKFKNKIGLTIDGKHLNQRGEVALAWPYKDCILEGGMSDEENGKDEIFFNEVLAQDEIDRLFDPKVLTNGKKFDKDGEKKFDGFTRNENGRLKDNLIIKGNNLLALHSLKKQFYGKVKLVYIDPPYNTGNDGFRYNDRFNHSTWLTFMKNRLEVARDLLREDGVIFINIDDDEGHYLKVLGDGIFGRENFIANIVWQKKYTVANDARYFSDNHDHILVFAKNKESLVLNRLERTEKMNKAYTNPDDHPKGAWKPTPLHAKSGVNTSEYVFQNGVKWSPPQGTFRRYSDETMEKMETNDEIWFGVSGDTTPSRKTFLSELKDKGVVSKTVWTFEECGHNHEAKTEFKELGFSEDFGTPKPERLLQRIIQLGSNENDLVLDFFAGSGTTGAVAHKMNRQYILVEQMDYIHDLPEARIKKVIEGEQGGISKAVNWQGGGSFIYFELKQYNEAFIAQIKSAKKTADLEKIWEEMKSKSFLNWNIDFRNADLAFGEWKNLNFEKQQQALMHLLNKNQLYVNLSEMEDKNMSVSPEDKKLSEGFYKKSN